MWFLSHVTCSISPVQQYQANNTLSQYFFYHSRLSKLSKIKAMKTVLNIKMVVLLNQLPCHFKDHETAFKHCRAVGRAAPSALPLLRTGQCTNEHHVRCGFEARFQHMSHITPLCTSCPTVSSSITANKIYIPPRDYVALHLMNPGMRLRGSLLYHHMDQQRHAPINYSSESL